MSNLLHKCTHHIILANTTSNQCTYHIIWVYTPHHMNVHHIIWVYTLHHMNVHHIIWVHTLNHMNVHHIIWVYTLHHMNIHYITWYITRTCTSELNHSKKARAQYHVIAGQPSVAPNASVRSDQGRSESEHRARDNFLPAVASSSSATFRSAATSSRIAALAERNCLFYFTDRAKSGAGGSSSRKAKKKRLDVWAHDFICLARADQEKSPTAMERGTLITAGKHEKLG